MSRISIPTFSVIEHSPQKRSSGTEPRTFRLGSPTRRIAAGATAAVAALAGAFCIFGPFSDMSARQLAAGPQSMATGPSGQLLVMAPTGRAWGAEHERRVATASAAPIATIARSEAPTMVVLERAAK
jgi:hypothetical protein